MKKLFISFFIVFLMLPLHAGAFEVPARPASYVSDYAQMLSEPQRVSLEDKIRNYENQSTNEIVVVTIDSLDNEEIADVAQQIFTKWGIGKKEKNNGVLLLISINDRKTRIQTGYGVEGDLTDLGTAYIQRDIIAPAFREGNYYDGINGAVDRMIEALSGASIVPENYEENKSKGNNYEFLIFIALFLFQFLLSILARSKSWWGGGVVGGLTGGVIWYLGIFPFVFSVLSFIGLIFLGLLIDFLVSRAYSKGAFRGANGIFWGGGGFGGGGRSGGGFGGFGGGSSGGGGSSSSW